MMERTKLAHSCAVVALGLFSLQSTAATVTFELNVEFSGGTPPAGTGPSWITATFEDVATDTVRLTIDNIGLTGTEYVSNFYFNVDNGIDATTLSPTHISGDSYNTLHTNSPTQDSTSLKADGDGYFDIRFQYKTAPPNQRFGAGKTSVYELSGTDLDAYDFNFISEPGGGAGSYFAAAHVQSIGANDDSGWIGAPVPVPAAVWLFGSGLIGLAAVARRKA